MKIRGPDGQVYNFPDDTPDSDIENFFNPQQEIKLSDLGGPKTYPGMGSLTPPAPEELVTGPGIAGMHALGAASRVAGETLTDITDTIMQEYGIEPPEKGRGLWQGPYPITAGALPGLALRKFRPDIAAKLDVAAGQMLEPATTPSNLMLLRAGGNPYVASYFMSQMAPGVPEELQTLAQTIEEGKAPEISGQLFKTGGTLALTGLLGKHLVETPAFPTPAGRRAYARSQQEAAEVYGDVRPQPGEGEGEVPAEKGGEGVQPQAPGGLAEETQVLLEQASTSNRFLGLGHEFQMLDDFGVTDPNHARLARANYASVDENGNFLAPGKIDVSRAAMELLFKEARPDAAVKALQSTLIEEGIHALTTPGEAALYGQTLTAVERAIGRRNYLKGWTAEEAGLTEGNLGGELLRQRVQQLMGLDTTEIADLAGKERWSVQSLEFIARLIRRFREMIGTKAASAGKTFAQGILDRAQKNIDTAMSAVEAGPEPAQMPAALRRKYEEERLQMRAPGEGAKPEGLPGVPREGAAEVPGKPSQYPQEPVPPVVRNVAHGTISPEALVPAIRLIGGEVVEGRPGETHPDIIKREGIKAEDIDQRGFSDPTGKGFFLDREAAAQGTGLATEKEPGRLHSTDLIREGEAADEQHSQDMDLARRIVDMTPEEFGREARAFNRINFRLGERASEAEIAELETLRDEANAQAERSRNEWAKDPANPEKQARAVSDMQKPQFFNEALKKHEEAMQSLQPQALDPASGRPLTATESLVSRLGGLRRKQQIESEIDDAIKRRGEYRTVVTRKTKWGSDRLSFEVQWHHLDPSTGKLVYSVTALEKPEGYKTWDYTVNRNFDTREQFINALHRYRTAEEAATKQPPMEGISGREAEPEGPAALRRKGRITDQEIRDNDPVNGIAIDPITPQQKQWLEENSGAQRTYRTDEGIDIAIRIKPSGLWVTASRPGEGGYTDTGTAYTHHTETRNVLNGNFGKGAPTAASKELSHIAVRELENVYKHGVPEATETAFPASLRRKTKRPESLEMPYTPERAAAAGDAYFTQTTAPHIKDFSKYMGARFGEMKPGVLRAEFEESFWRWAEKASGEDIARALRDEGLYKKLRIESTEGEVRKIADPLSVEQARVPFGEEKLRSLQLPEQRLRANALASLADKLLVQAEGGRSFLKRTEVDPYEDLADPRVATKQPVYHEITEDLQKDPVALGQMLTEDARAYGGEKTQRVVNGQVVTVSKKGFPVSASKRLTALQNRVTGKVSLVSTYRDGRRGPVVVEPGVPGNKAHSTIEQILPRYRVIASMLTDEPVQGFRKDFDSLGDYQREFGSAARDTAEHGMEYEPPEASVQAEPYRVLPREEVTPEEADSIMDQVVGEVGYPKSVEDVKTAWEALKDDPRSRRVFTAMRKLGRELSRREPDLSQEAFLDKLAKQIYENHAKARTPEEFRRLTMEQSRAPAGEAVRVETAPGKEGPASLRRKGYTVADETRRIALGIAATVERGDIMTEIPALRDAADNIAHDEAFRVENHIRGATRKKALGLFYGKKEVLSAANAQIAAGAIEPQYAWTAALRKIQNDLINKNKATPKAKALMKSTNPADRAQAKAMFARIRKEAIATMIQNRDLNATAPSYKFNPASISELADFERRVQNGIRNAENLMRTGGWKGRIKGAAWKAGAEALLKELQYARAHWSDPDLIETSTRARRLLDQRYDRETDNGSRLKYDHRYMPGRYDAEFFNDESVLFGPGGPRVLGKLWKKPKSFRNYYEAIEDDAYIAMSRDIADIVSHRARQGERSIQQKQWIESLKNYTDRTTNQPVAMDAKSLPGGGYASPILGWELIYPRSGHAPIAVHPAYYRLIKALTGESAVQASYVSRALLEWEQRLKHTILLGDFFHLARLSYYSLSIMGGKALLHGPYRRGLTALEFNEADLPEAVRAGVISVAEARWATERIPLRVGNQIRFTTRMGVLREFERSGLNVGRIADAIYKDLVQSVPLLGRYNKWLFDRYTRGMMAQAAVMEFERQQKANPSIMPDRLIRDISRDLNQYFGSIGRQGLFKSATWQDIMRMTFLAPQWVEGLLDKELVSAKRAAGIPLHMAGLYRNNLNALGTMGRGIGRGMVVMLALTQVINLINRGKPTWENEEEDHKWDAWIKTRDGRGLWLSPLSVFNELSHDLVRLGHSKPRFMDAINQIGSNKLSPWGRLAVALYTGLTPQREYIPTTGGVLAEAAKGMIPVPISFGRLGQFALHKAFPGAIPPTQPGAVERQFLATAGLKVEPGAQPALIASRMAQDFVAKNFGKVETIKIIPTTEPSYTKLRNALRDEDYVRAKKILRALEKTRDDKKIDDDMRLWAHRPFTGSNEYEKAFREALQENPNAARMYDKAIEQKEAEYQAFRNWLSKQQD